LGFLALHGKFNTMSLLLAYGVESYNSTNSSVLRFRPFSSAVNEALFVSALCEQLSLGDIYSCNAVSSCYCLDKGFSCGESCELK
jgi:hypothetical protein